MQYHHVQLCICRQFSKSTWSHLMLFYYFVSSNLSLTCRSQLNLKEYKRVDYILNSMGQCCPIFHYGISVITDCQAQQRSKYFSHTGAGRKGKICMEDHGKYKQHDIIKTTGKFFATSNLHSVISSTL